MKQKETGVCGRGGTWWNDLMDCLHGNRTENRINNVIGCAPRSEYQIAAEL